MSASDVARVVDAITARRDIEGLSEADLALVAFAKKLTATPSRMSEADVAKLRALEFSERAIYDITSIACLFAYVTRLASGLGLPLEPDWEAVYPQIARRNAPPTRAEG